MTLLQAFLKGIAQGQLQLKALPLILQRTVMVAMEALSHEGLAPFVLSFEGLVPSKVNRFPRLDLTSEGDLQT